MAIAVFLYTLLLLKQAHSDDNHEHGMVIDAGSTHSSLYIYEFVDRVTSTNIPPQSSPQQIAASDNTDPIGHLKSQEDCDALIQTLINFAKHTLVKDKYRWNEFPIYLKATAGMRILNNEDRERILTYLKNSFLNETINPFLFDPTYAIIASGEEEAAFDWLGVNYIFGALLNENEDKDTFGALDLGGRSTQIAFSPRPNSNILAEFTAIRLWQTTHRLYSHSFLQYGTEAIEERVAQLSYEEMTDAATKTTHNPCLNTGVNITYTVVTATGHTASVVQFGSAKDDPYRCRSMIRKLLANDTECFVGECSFNGVYQAEIPPNMTFIAFGAFGYVINGLQLEDDIDLGQLYYDVTLKICNMTYAELKASKFYSQYSEKFLNSYCRSCTYIYTLLHEGYGFSLDNTPVRFLVKYDGVSVSWTQGSILRDSNWLPYELEFVKNDALSSEGVMWRTITITLGCMFVVILVGFVFALWKLRKSESDLYSNML